MQVQTLLAELVHMHAAQAAFVSVAGTDYWVGSSLLSITLSQTAEHAAQIAPALPQAAASLRSHDAGALSEHTPVSCQLCRAVAQHAGCLVLRLSCCRSPLQRSQQLQL